MFYTHPTKRTEKKTGFLDTYHLETEKAKLNVGTLVGGWQDFPTVNSTRYFYILKGMGNAIVKESDQHHLVVGNFIEVPANSFCKLEGQLQFVEVTGDTHTSIEKVSGNFTIESSDKAHFIYIVEGLGNGKMNGKNQVLRDGSFVEIPKDVPFEFNGNATYILSTIN